MGTLWEYKTEWITGVVIMFLLYFFLKYIFPLVSPFLWAFLTVYALFPFLYKIEKKFKLKKPITMMLLLTVIGGVLAGIIALCVYYAGGNIQEWCNNLLSYIPTDIMEKIKDSLPDILVNSVSAIQRVTPVFAYVGIYIIATVLLSKDFEQIMENVRKVGALDAFMTGMEKVIHTVGIFLKSQGIIMVLNAVICAIGLTIGGVPYSIAWGILAGVLDALPFIGTGIVLVPIAGYLFFGGNVWGGIITVLIYVICVALREFMEPKLMGDNLDIYPVVLLFSIFAGLHLFGVSGIIKGPIGVILYKYLFWAFLRQRVDK